MDSTGAKLKAAKARQHQANNFALLRFLCIAATTCSTPSLRVASYSSRTGRLALSISLWTARSGHRDTGSSGSTPTAHSTSCWQHATSTAGSCGSSSIRRTTRFAAASALWRSIISAKPPSMQKSAKEIFPLPSLSHMSQHRSIHSRLAATAVASNEEVPADFRTARRTSPLPISRAPGRAQCRNHPSRSCSSAGGCPRALSSCSSARCSASHLRSPRSAQKAAREIRPSPAESHSVHSSPRSAASSRPASTGTTAGNTFSSNCRSR
mmetsp:Transcript_53723/g.149016  ORF Transcript_53723/g.149016 Transcript_53723/m.149016 type:complete len:267 (-) Transcript_53723:1768-2568(-)